MGIRTVYSRTVIVTGTVNLAELIQKLSGDQTEAGTKKAIVSITSYDVGNDPREVSETTFNIIESS